MLLEIQRARAGQWLRFTRKETVIHCPGCNASVADGTAICPKCDYIIDSSFLSGDPAPSAPPARPAAPPKRTGTSTGQRAASAGPRPTGQQRVAKPASGGTSGARPAGAPASRPPPKPAPRPAPASDPMEADIPTGPGLPAMSSAARAQAARDKAEIAPEEAVRDIKSFVSALNGGDKLAVIGASIVVLSGFLPWLENTLGEAALGLMCSGILSVLAAALAVAAVVLRVRKAMPNVPPVTLWMVQLVGAVVALLWSVIFLKTGPGSYVDEETGATIVTGLMLGVYIAIPAALVAVLGSLMRLTEKPS